MNHWNEFDNLIKEEENFYVGIVYMNACFHKKQE